MNIRIGTSGWSYNHWKGVFYPESLSKNKWLEFYSKYLDTVEINSTFYRKFKETTYKNWFKRTPENFIFSLKIPKLITHNKRLKETENEIEEFITITKSLKNKLRIYLIQLPPSFKFDYTTLKDFFQLINNYDYKFTIEVRNKTFNNEMFFQLLNDFNIALCISDTANRYPLFMEITANFVYIRLHGSKKLYASKYSKEELEFWAKKILEWGKDTFIYFDNDFEGHAPQNALELKKILYE